MRSRDAVLEGGLIVAGFVVLFFFLPHALVGDDRQRFKDIEQLLHHGTLSDSKYSLVMPLFSVPVLALGKVVESPAWWAARFNVIVVAAGVAVACWLLRGRADPRLVRLILLVLLSASFLTDRLRDYNAEVMTATFVAVGIICVATGRRVVAGWAAIVIGVVNTPAAIAGLALLAGWEALRTRRVRYLVPLVAAAVLIMIEDWVRRGGPLVTGYGNDHGVRTIMPYSGQPGYSYPFLLGVAAILFSFGRGLLFFMPGLALWLDGRTRALLRPAPGQPAVTMMLLFTAGLVLVYARWWAWYGGLAWGPRFFLFAALPASVLLAARIWRAGRSPSMDAVTLGVLVLSAWVGCAGAIAGPNALSVCSAGNYQNEQLCWFTPDFSPLWQPVRQFPHLTASTTIVALYCGAVFCYLAAPLVIGLLRSVHLKRSWAEGWRL
ncbi:MAG TPA: hypothetical protein VHO07_00310 [Streptosporangiaceae bacterium]|nr:hypothetical protein [Streptosporangiaceae bacterium]